MAPTTCNTASPCSPPRVPARALAGSSLFPSALTIVHSQRKRRAALSSPLPSSTDANSTYSIKVLDASSAVKYGAEAPVKAGEGSCSGNLENSVKLVASANSSTTNSTGTSTPTTGTTTAPPGSSSVDPTVTPTPKGGAERLAPGLLAAVAVAAAAVAF